MRFPFRLATTLAFCAVVAGGAVALAGSPAAGTSGSANVPVPAEVVINGRKVLDMGFATLSSFPYKVVDIASGATKEQIEAAAQQDQIPPAVHAYDGKAVVLTGFMMPLQLEGGLTKKFVMMKDINTCCYGAIPQMNDYVVVEMKGDGIESIQDIPVRLTGVLHIAEKREEGYVVSLFEMDGEKFLGPLK